MAEDVEKEEEEEEAEAEQDQGLVEEEEEEEEDVSEQDHGLEDEESEGKHCDTQDDNLATEMKKSENGTNGTEAGADDWSCDQNLGEEQCLGDGEEDEASVEEEAFKTYNLIATELGEDDEDVNNSIEDDEEDFSEGGEVDNGDQEVVDEELGLDKEADDEEQGVDNQDAEVGDEKLGVDDEEQGVDQQDYDVVDEELSVGDEVDDEEQGGDQQQDDEVGGKESPAEDENNHKTAGEEGGMNCELKQESLEKNEPKTEEHHENLEEHKLQETNAFEEGRMDEEDLKKKNKTNFFELDEAPLEPQNLMLTTTLSTSSMASATSASLSAPEENKVDQEKGGWDVKPGVQFSRLDQGGNLKEKIERADSEEGEAESFSVEKKEARGPILMFSTLGKNVGKVEEITDEENEAMELELEVEELDCALQKKLEDKNKRLDLEDEEEDDDEELEDKERNLLYDSFEEKLQNIFRRI